MVGEGRAHAPGPELTRAAQPRLFALLDGVAARCEQRPVDRVHLTLDLNAGVLEHRGDRILHLGHGLMSVLEPDELRAVMAHEHGHYAGGDTRLVHWTWRTEASAVATVQHLAASGSRIIRWPFQLYAMLLLRITSRVSRRAEFLADRFAAQRTSADALGRALTRLASDSGMFDGYLASDLSPMTAAGLLPPVDRGFAMVLASPDMAEYRADALRDRVDDTDDPYASHPTYAARRAALGQAVPVAPLPPSTHPVVELLDDLRALERQLVDHVRGPRDEPLRDAEWDDAGRAQLAAADRATTSCELWVDPTLRVMDAGDAIRDEDDAVRRLRAAFPEDSEAPDEYLAHVARSAYIGLAVVGLAGAGAAVTGPPGEPVRLWYEGAMLEPFSLLNAVVAGEADPSSWSDHPIVAALGRGPLAPDGRCAPRVGAPVA